MKVIIRYEYERLILDFQNIQIPDEVIQQLIAVKTSELVDNKIVYYPYNNLNTYQQITKILDNHDLPYFMHSNYFTTLL